MLFEDFVELNPKVKLEKGKEYPFVEMGIISPSHRYVVADQSRVFKGGGAKFKSGDTLFARITPCLENGKIAQYIAAEGECGFGSTEFFVFRAKKNISDPAYVYYLSLTDEIRGPAEKSMFGASGRQRADLDVVRNVIVNDITLESQKKIASILSAYDDLLENNLRRIRILEEMAQLIYREWFVKFRFPGHEKVKMMDSPLGKIPEGWEVVNLGSLTTKLTKGTTPTTLGKAFTYDGINFFKVESISESGSVLESKLAKIDEETDELLKRSKIIPGDILFSIAGAIGRSTIVSERHTPANTNQALAIIRPKDKSLTKYLYLTMRSDSFQHFSLGRVVQTAQANVSLGILKSAPILLPKANIKDNFETAVSPMLSGIENFEKKNELLRQTRDLLLPKLISGQLDVSELDIDIKETAA